MRFQLVGLSGKDKGLIHQLTDFKGLKSDYRATKSSNYGNLQQLQVKTAKKARQSRRSFKCHCANSVSYYYNTGACYSCYTFLLKVGLKYKELMKTYKVIVRFDNKEFEIEVEGENWEDVCEYVFGRIEVIDKENN